MSEVTYQVAFLNLDSRIMATDGGLTYIDAYGKFRQIAMIKPGYEAR